MSRRRLLRLGAGISASALAGGLAHATPTSAAAGGWYKALTSLKLRAKASTSAKVLLVMPAGAIIEDLGTSKNGFAKVKYQGTAGWAYADYLASTNTDLDPYLTGWAETTRNVNLRQYPETGAKVLAVAAKGSEIQTSDSVVDGFRFVSFDGSKGWMWDDYIGSIEDGIHPGDYVTVTVNLNLRQKPDGASKVMLVMPAGSEVQALAESENGFRTVVYQGTTGWAYESYLQA